VEKIAISWSSGKDSTLCLHTLLRERKYEISYLLTTVTEPYYRVSMHGVREDLLILQAESIGVKLMKVYIPAGCSNELYEKKMSEACAQLQNMGVTAIAFADIFLEDVRRYREKNLVGTGIRPLFPLWGRNTRELAHEFLDLGYKAIVVCVDLEKLTINFAGREYDRTFLKDLPEGCDPCGENGEFHTFVYSGPIFKKPIPFSLGEKVIRENRFCYQDLLLTHK